MQTHWFFPRLFLLAALVLVALAPVGRAQAAAPVIEFVTFEFTYKLDQQPCPGIEVWNHEVFTWRITTFLEPDGSVKKIRIHGVEGTDELYNLANPSNILVARFGGNGELDLETGALINASGTSARLLVPGYGRVLMLTGHWLVYPTIHLGGIDSFEDPEDMADFCALLAVP